MINKNNDNETLTKKKLVSFGLVTSDDRLTIAGMLFSDNNINKNSNMICTTWPSLTKGTNDYQDSKSFEGSLVMLLHKAIEYIKEVPYYYFGVFSFCRDKDTAKRAQNKRIYSFLC